jgi:hypothetical protein
MDMKLTAHTATRCPGCGAALHATGSLRSHDAPAAGCRARFAELVALERADLRRMRAHALTRDAYAVQHPGEESDETIRTVGVHLISLYAQLALGVSYREVKRIRAEAAQALVFRWLPPPEQRGDLTVLHPLAAEHPEDHVRRVQEWAHSAWRAWYPHHDQVMSWARRILGQGRVSEPPPQSDLGWYAGARNAVHPSTDSGPSAD